MRRWWRRCRKWIDGRHRLAWAQERIEWCLLVGVPVLAAKGSPGAEFFLAWSLRNRERLRRLARK